MKLTNRFTVATAAILGLQSPFGLASDLSAHPEYLKFERYVAWGYLGTYIGREGTRTFEERGTTLQIDHKDEHSRPTMTTIFTFNT